MVSASALDGLLRKSFLGASEELFHLAPSLRARAALGLLALVFDVAPEQRGRRCRKREPEAQIVSTQIAVEFGGQVSFSLGVISFEPQPRRANNPHCSSGPK